MKKEEVKRRRLKLNSKFKFKNDTKLYVLNDSNKKSDLEKKSEFSKKVELQNFNWKYNPRKFNKLKFIDDSKLYTLNKINEKSELEKRIEFSKNIELRDFKEKYNKENNIRNDYSIVLNSDQERIDYENKFFDFKKLEKIDKYENIKNVAYSVLKGASIAAATSAMNSFALPWIGGYGVLALNMYNPLKSI